MKKSSVLFFVAISLIFLCFFFLFLSHIFSKDLLVSYSLPTYETLKSTKARPLAKESLLIAASIPTYSSEKEKEPSVTESFSPYFVEEEDEILPLYITERNIKKGETSLFGVEINNETSYNLENAYKEPASFKDSKLLIIHTHTSESYRPTKKYNYTPSDNSRTEDKNFNVARVGSYLFYLLNEGGITAFHDDTLNDYPSYNGSYQKALTLIQGHLEKNPSINIVLDIHRDAMEKEDGTKISTVCDINGKKAAQLMFVVGTDEGGLYHPTWRQNFSFAVKLQKILDEKYPGLMRPINVRSERFNGHLSPGEIIIEVGTTGNTLEEALLSINALSDGLSFLIQGS